MKTILIDCWELTQPDGAGQYDEHVGYIASEKEAINWQKNASRGGWPGSYKRYHKVVTVFDSLEEMIDNSPSKLKERAIEKAKKALTPQELEVLGIK